MGTYNGGSTIINTRKKKNNTKNHRNSKIKFKRLKKAAPEITQSFLDHYREQSHRNELRKNRFISTGKFIDIDAIRTSTNSRLCVGDKVIHLSFGGGTIVAISGEVVTVNFKVFRRKKILEEFLTISR